MSTFSNGVERGAATADDCAHLWELLIQNFIPDLRIEMKPHCPMGQKAYVRMELVDYANISDAGPPHRSVWAVREFHSEVYLISYGQLFDLLIVGYRTIEEYFSTGRDKRPTH